MNFKVTQFCIKNVTKVSTHEYSGVDVVGDVHGCAKELEKMLTNLGYNLETYLHPENRLFVFLGDIVDRGPENKKCFEIALKMRDVGHIWIVGNHDNKFLRFLKGNPVTLNHGAEMTAVEFENSPEFKNKEFAVDLLNDLPFKVVLEGEDVLMHLAHAYPLGNSPDLCMYGPINRESLRIDWWENPSFPQSEKVQYALFGHYWLDDELLMKVVESKKFVSCLDTSCCAGGSLSVFRYPENHIVTVDSEYSFETV